jgi:S-adenosylmethionine:tRNA-ribosyltransferase-isomerase (queuine synthetase)
MSPQFGVEHIEDIVDELAPLTVKHHAEVNAFPDTPLNINWNKYAIAKKYRFYSFGDCSLLFK